MRHIYRRSCFPHKRYQLLRESTGSISKNSFSIRIYLRPSVFIGGYKPLPFAVRLDLSYLFEIQYIPMKKLILQLALAIIIATPIASDIQAADMSVLPSSLRGIVLWPDGETPVYDMRVHVWDAKNERTVFKTRTDKNGVFHLPEFTEGELYLTAGPVRIDLTVLQAQEGIISQPHAVVIILPKVMPFVPRLLPFAGAAPLFRKVVSP